MSPLSLTSLGHLLLFARYAYCRTSPFYSSFGKATNYGRALPSVLGFPKGFVINWNVGTLPSVSLTILSITCNFDRPRTIRFRPRLLPSIDELLVLPMITAHMRPVHCILSKGGKHWRLYLLLCAKERYQVN